MIDISFDMETSDPDDVFTLCLLATHPKVNLRSVTISPGSKQQVGVVSLILKTLDKSIPIGSARPNYHKACVSEFHYKWLGNPGIADPDGLGSDILLEAIKQYPDLKIVTGAPLTNIGELLKNNSSPINEIVIQGGFAGDSVVPAEYRLDKFKGRETCPTFNLNGNIEAAKAVISSKAFGIKRFVSKNVCHGIIYDYSMHERIKPFRHNNAGLKLLIDGMEFYLKNKSSGKAFHDPLAACVAIDSSCCEFKQASIYREKGEWGAKLEEGNSYITIHCNREKFEEILIGK